MTKIVLILFTILFINSCQTSVLQISDFQWNYDIIDRLVQNPDSLDVFKNCFHYSRSLDTIYKSKGERKEIESLVKMVVEKLKINDFKSGYTIIDEKVEDKSYLINSYSNKNNPNYSENIALYWHSMFIKSNKTGKRIFFMFRYYFGWTLFDIHTIIINKDSILEY